MLDLHNHILPGLDDGALDWGQSIAMARLAMDDGVTGIVCTPHWVSGYCDNTLPLILQTTDAFREKLEAADIPLSVFPGAELRLDYNLVERLKSEEVLTLNNTGHYALIEFPAEILPHNLDNFFWELQANDITPIISHPERHSIMMHNPAMLYKWVAGGILVQITSASLLGRFGSEVRKHAIYLMEHRMAHIIATDAHGLTMRSPRLSEGVETARSIVGGDLAHRMVHEYPQSIIDGVPILVPDPIPLCRNSKPSVATRFFSFLGLRPR